MKFRYHALATVPPLHRHMYASVNTQREAPQSVETEESSGNVGGRTTEAAARQGKTYWGDQMLHPLKFTHWTFFRRFSSPLVGFRGPPESSSALRLALWESVSFPTRSRSPTLCATGLVDSVPAAAKCPFTLRISMLGPAHPR